MTLRHIITDENRGALRRVLCRERGRRQPPKVSGPPAVAPRSPSGFPLALARGLHPNRVSEERENDRSPSPASAEQAILTNPP